MSANTDRLPTPLEPLFLSCTDEDFTFQPEARRKAIDIMRAGEKQWHTQLFTGVRHGFALRCNLDVPYERRHTFLFLYAGLLEAANT
jgi:hypothetical protein